MAELAADSVRYEFVTQLPRDDGCGVCVLQMLTGKSYDQIACMIDWGVQTSHYTTWKELQGVLVDLGWNIGQVRKAQSWGDIAGPAIVHVEGDHFILYDGDEGVFYDPGLQQGPHLTTRLVPLTYLLVHRPSCRAQQRSHRA